MDKQQVAPIKSITSKGIAALPQKSQEGILGGDKNKMIQTMVDVKFCHLLKTNLFQLKEKLLLCIAKEVNLCQIKVKTIRNDHNNFIIARSNFCLYTTHSVQLSWVVRAACCREGGNTSTIPPNLRYIKENGLLIPFKSKWVALLLQTTNKVTPGLPYQMMHEILKPYINECASTNTILQEACDKAKVNLFSDLKDNVKYTYQW
jgi:hypothetical protein